MADSICSHSGDYHHLICEDFAVVVVDVTRPWTDADLYAKYNLTDDEIAYIEKLIKPME